MKRAALLLCAGLAALAAAKESLNQAILSAGEPTKNAPSWWEVEVYKDSALHSPGESLERAIEKAELALARLLSDDDGDDNDDYDDDDDIAGGGHHHHHRGDNTKTIYELIKENEHTTRFAALVDEHEDISDLLRSTKTNRTLFVPTDRAFERIPPDHDKPSASFIRDLLAYAIVPGYYPSRRLYVSPTLATELHPRHLGGHAQRLRVSSSVFSGTHLNFFTKVVVRDIGAKNGLIHAVDSITIPPPRCHEVIHSLPQTFSTFALAMARTTLGRELSQLDLSGYTTFVPTNRAFARLGPRANAFLFSERGLKYLKALLKYTIVANETLYSDAFYRGHGDNKPGGDDGDDGDDGDYALPTSEQWHVDLPSLLHDEPISVDIKQWGGFISILVNGYTRVAVRDIVGSDGVLQVIDSVLIPPKRRHGYVATKNDDREWSVAELMDRLDPYLVDGPTEETIGDL